MNTCKSVSKQTTLTSFRINTYEKTGGGVRVCVATALPWGIWVSFMVHLFIRRSCGPFRVDLLYAERFPGGLSRHIRVRFNAVVASANSAATFPSPRIRNRLIPRCSFKIPMTVQPMLSAVGITLVLSSRLTCCACEEGPDDA